MKGHWIFILLLMLAFAVNAQQSDSLIIEALKRYPMLEECQIPGFPEKTLCGQLMVYENHQAGEGKKIPIEVVVLPATTKTPGHSAFTGYWGGIGNSAKTKLWICGRGSSAEKIRETRDIVLMDDRGNGASGINCNAIDSLKPYSYALIYDEKLIKKCLEQTKDKVDLSLYTTPYVIQDYEEVRKWLGLEQYDIFGISYGTRFGLEYMRRYPQQTRTLTIQAVDPPGFNYINEMDVSIQEQLEMLFKRCAEDSLCSQYYPHFKKELYATRDRLKAHPVNIEYQLEDGNSASITMDDLLFRRMVGHLILHGNLNEALPFFIHRAYMGNYVPLVDAGGSLTLGMPVFLSKFCPEEVERFAFDPEGFGADTLFTEGAIGQEKVSACTWWQEMPAADWLEKPMDGKSPILILTGEYDANTPIRMGEQVRRAFPNQSRHIILPRTTHSGETAYDCAYHLTAQFIETKDLQGLDTTCIFEIKSTPFTYELPISDEAFDKYSGEYTTGDPGKSLSLYRKNGMPYLQDEYGSSQLLYKGDHTFVPLDCSRCKIIFEMDGETVSQVQRDYREKVTFKPKGNE